MGSSNNTTKGYSKTLLANEYNLNDELVIFLFKPMIQDIKDLPSEILSEIFCYEFMF